MEHALSTEQGWIDYGKANANSPNKAEAFTACWSNLVRHQAGFSQHDRERFLRIFMDAACEHEYGMFHVCRKCGQSAANGVA